MLRKFIVGLAIASALTLGVYDATSANETTIVTGCIKPGLNVAVKCNGDGTFTLTLTGTPTSPIDVTMTSQTPGVTVTPPQQTWTGSGTWTLTGATPGQTVTLFVNATKTGGGSVEGSDLCCSGTITVVMPECPPPVTAIDLGIAKIGEAFQYTAGGPFNFTIGVMNLGAAITGPTTLTFTDVVPAGMTFNSYTSSNWNCSPIAAASGVTVTCTYSGTFPIAANQPLGWVNFVASGGSGSYTNCANLGQPDSNPTNDKACTTVQKGLGNLIVVKEIINKTDPQISTSGLVFPVTVTCGSTVTTLNLVNGLPQTVNNIPFNTTCSVVEGTPPVPTGTCPTPPGGSPTWTTTYVPPTPVMVVSGTTATIRVQNTLDCKSQETTGYLLVQKIIKNNTQASLTGLTFPAIATCGGNATPLTLSVGSAQVVHNVPVGAVCTVVETLPAAPTAGCDIGQVPTWVTPPTYLPSSVTMTSGSGPTITVQNTLICAPPVQPCSGTGSLKIKKISTSAGTAFSASWGFDISCTAPANLNTSVLVMNGTMDIGTAQVNNIATCSTCTVTEQVRPLYGLCPAGTYTVLQPPTYAPSSSVVITGGGAEVTVTNAVICSPTPPVCQPPLISGPTGECKCPIGMVVVYGKCEPGSPVPPPIVCPPGTVLQGSECVKQTTCQPPMVQGPVAGVCICPPGTVQKGRECIRQITCSAPKVPNAAGKECICPQGTVPKGRECVPARAQPEKPKRCPEGTTKQGSKCVKQEKPKVNVTPRDVINGIGVIRGIGGRSGSGGGAAPTGGGYTPGKR